MRVSAPTSSDRASAGSSPRGCSTATAAAAPRVYRATDAGHRALSGYLERTRLAYAQDHAGRGWDRRWHLVAFAVPESPAGRPRRPPRPPARPRRRSRPQRPVRVAAPLGGRGAGARPTRLGVRRVGDRRLLRRPRRRRRERTPRHRPAPVADRRARRALPAASSPSTTTSPAYLDRLFERRERMSDEVFLSGRPRRDRRVPVDLQRRPAPAARAAPPALARPSRPRASCCAAAARRCGSARAPAGRPSSAPTTT